MRGDTRGRDYKGTKKLGVVKVIDAQVATKVSGGDGRWPGMAAALMKG